ncbi:MAG: hypothetical protein ABIJ34_08865 [archaeon]
MIELAMLGLAILIMAYALLKSIRFMALMTNDSSKMEKFIVPVLCGFFFLGYLLYLYLILAAAAHFNNLLVISIFLFGAIFVVIVETRNYNLLSRFNLTIEDLNAKNSELTKNKRHMAEINAKLSNVQKELTMKNAELENTMEEFYTLRLSLEKSAENKSIKKENTKIRNKIDKLRRP